MPVTKQEMRKWGRSLIRVWLPFLLSSFPPFLLSVRPYRSRRQPWNIATPPGGRTVGMKRILALSALVIVAYGCNSPGGAIAGAKPEDTVNAFIDALNRKDEKAADECLYT